MQDHKAAKLPYNRGVTHREIYNTTLHEHGQSMHGGVRKGDPGVTRGGGIPMVAGKISNKAPEKVRCAGKDGTCQAYPVKGELYCYGHLRSLSGSGHDQGSDSPADAG